MTHLSVPLPCRRSTLHLAQRLGPLLQPGDLVILTGPLGAGKTFFVRGLARALGLPSEVPVTSPTFALVQQLETHPPLIHADLYRLGEAEEAEELGLEAARREGQILLVEWGDHFADALGGDALSIALSRSPKTATVTASGTAANQRLEQLRALLPLPPRGEQRRLQSPQ